MSREELSRDVSAELSANATIERYVPQGSLEQREIEELALVGLSSKFPALMQELNEAITTLGYGNNFRGYRFTMTPDPNKPSIDAQAIYVPRFTVVFDAHEDRTAKLSIQQRGSGNSLGRVALSDLKQYFARLPEGSTNTYLEGQRRPESHEQTDLPTVRLTLADAHNEDDLRSHGLVPAKWKLQAVYSESQNNIAASIKMDWVVEHRVVEPVFDLSELEISGPSSVVEAAAGHIATLLSSIPLYK